MTDRWTSQPIICKGGIDQSVDILTLGTQTPGAATILQNYEPSIAGGYARIEGYTKWDTNTVPGTTGKPVLGVCAALGGVFAARYNTSTTSNDVYFSSGSGWTKINTATRPSTSVTKVRMLSYALAAQSIYITDGVNPAAKWDGTTYTQINGTGAPSNPSMAAYFTGIMALAGYGNGTQLSLSAPLSDTDFSGADGAVEIEVGDTITGLKTFRDTLYIFCLNSIWQLTGTDSTTYVFDAVTKGIGCLGQDTILEIGGDLIYLAPDGFRSLAATFRIGDLQLGLLSRKIHPILNTQDFLQGNSLNSYSAVHIAAKNQYRCWSYDSAITTAETFGVIGRRIDDPVNVVYEWGTLLGINPYCAHSQYVNEQEVVVIGDPSNGYVYRLESGSSFDGTPIQAIYRTPDLTFSDATMRKVMQKITLYTQATGAIDISLQVELDAINTNSLQPAPIALISGSQGSVYGTAVYGANTYSLQVNPYFKVPLVGSGFLIALEFTSNDSNPPHRIDSFQIEFSPKGRR